MPIYEYHCQKCGESFEKLVFKGDSEEIDCPECGGAEVKKLLSCASFMSKSSIGSCSTSAPKGFS